MDDWMPNSGLASTQDTVQEASKLDNNTGLNTQYKDKAHKTRSCGRSQDAFVRRMQAVNCKLVYAPHILIIPSMCFKVHFTC